MEFGGSKMEYGEWRTKWNTEEGICNMEYFRLIISAK